MSGKTFDTLSYMVNQIARNFAAHGEEVAVEATAQHIIEYWAPRMKAVILVGNGASLSPIARGAISRLRVNGLGKN